MIRFFYILFFVFVLNVCFCQIRTMKPVKTRSKTTTLAIGVGMARSVVYLNRNVKENNDANGLNASLIYGLNNLLRLSADYTYYYPINIEPTWFNIKANTFEVNTHIIARFKNTEAFFYPLFGVSYNNFKGYFTGKNDFLNLADKYKINQINRSVWWGLNVGTGYEIFFRRLSLFLDYKMRVGISDDKSKLNIMDVCFGGGLRYNFKAPSLYKLFKGTRNRYLID